MSLSDIHKTFARVPADVVREAAQYQPAILADVAGRRGALHGRIRALRPSMRMAGTALTVEVRPGDNLMIHAALALAQPGDVLVIDGKADQSCALMGAIMMHVARVRQLAGVVMDGAARDSLEIAEMGFPVFSVGTNPNGPTKQVGGRIGYPVSVGGVTVCAGDFVCGDADGVVVVEREKIAGLLPLAAHKVKAEAQRIEAIEAGDTDAPWLQEALVSAGVLKPGQTL